jgi:hypothetical protein
MTAARELLQQALDVLYRANEAVSQEHVICITEDSIHAIRAHLAKPEPEPVFDEVVDPNANKSPTQLRNEGRAYCPKCFTFGHSHRKGCRFEGEGMTHHTKDQL